MLEPHALTKVRVVLQNADESLPGGSARRRSQDPFEAAECDLGDPFVYLSAIDRGGSLFDPDAAYRRRHLFRSVVMRRCVWRNVTFDVLAMSLLARPCLDQRAKRGEIRGKGGSHRSIVGEGDADLPSTLVHEFAFDDVVGQTQGVPSLQIRCGPRLLLNGCWRV